MKKLTEARLIVGAPNQHADLLYATQFKGPDPIVYLRVGNRAYVVVPEMELGRARSTCRGISVWTPEKLGLRPAQRRRLSDWVAGLLTKAGVRHVHVPGAFPLGVARELERRGVRLTVDRAPFFPSRQIKTPAEVRKLREAQTATVAAMRAAVALIAGSRITARGLLKCGATLVTAELVRAHINRTLLDRQCAGGEPIVACGPAAANPHDVGHGPLRASQAIVIDIFPQHLTTGYWGDLTRTVVKGPPRPEIARMFAAVRAVQKQALAAIRPRVQAARVHRMVEEEFERRGFPRQTVNGQPAGFIHGTGHGVGLEVHEAPSLSRGGPVLRAGHVVTVEPGLYHPDIGGVRIEDLVVVTPTGFAYLARCPIALVVP
jgi:Xaa-Pro aminopeptidase